MTNNKVTEFNEKEELGDKKLKDKVKESNKKEELGDKKRRDKVKEPNKKEEFVKKKRKDKVKEVNKKEELGNKKLKNKAKESNKKEELGDKKRNNNVKESNKKEEFTKKKRIDKVKETQPIRGEEVFQREIFDKVEEVTKQEPKLKKEKQTPNKKKVLTKEERNERKEKKKQRALALNKEWIDWDVVNCKRKEEEENEGLLKPFPECIVPRKNWGAVPPLQEGEPLEHPVPNVVFTYKTGVEKCENSEQCERVLKELQRRHIEEGMSDIGFNFLIGGDNRVYEGRGWHVQPDPNYQFPELQGKRLDVGFIGDYNTDKEELSWTMAGLGIDLAHYGVGQAYLVKRYRLVETQLHLIFDVYEPNKEEKRPELKLRFEDYYPGNVIEPDDEEDLLHGP